MILILVGAVLVAVGGRADAGVRVGDRDADESARSDANE